PDLLRAKVMVLVDMWRRRAALLSSVQQTEAELRLIIDGVRDHAISLLDAQGRIRTFNKPAERIKGYALAEVQGRHFEMFFTPEDRAGGLPQRELTEAAARGRFEGEGWRQRKDGSRFYAAVSLSPLRDHDGALVGFVKVTQDITERRRMAEELRARENLLRLIVDAIPALVAYVNPDVTFRTVNRAFTEWFDVPEESAAGQPVAAVIGDAAYATLKPHLDAALAGRPVAFEAEVDYARFGRRWI